MYQVTQVLVGRLVYEHKVYEHGKSVPVQDALAETLLKLKDNKKRCYFAGVKTEADKEVLKPPPSSAKVTVKKPKLRKM